MPLRLVAFAVFAVVVFPVEMHANDKVATTKQAKETQQVDQSYKATESAKADDQIDPIVTGGTVQSDHLTQWKIQSALYEECPECVANQPFPED